MTAARYQSLKVVVGWNYRLLPEHEAGLFRRPAVFRGRPTLEAAG